MATRTKTVRYSVPSRYTSAASATQIDLTQITVDLPDIAAGANIVTAYLELSFATVVAATSITIGLWYARLGAAAYSTGVDPVGGVILANTGEDMRFVKLPVDFTSYFQTNWSGTSMTLDTRFNITATSGTINHTAIWVITYTYDDTSATQVKTVAIPLESLTGALPTTATNFGTSQIPQLTGVGGILPEASITIKNYFFVIEGNSGAIGTTDYTVSARIDALTTTTSGTFEAGAQTANFQRLVYQPADGTPSTTTTHNLQLWASVAQLHHITVTLYVTYTFALSGTTRIINSIQLAVEMTTPIGATTSADASAFSRTLLISEPGTITIRQSAVRLDWAAFAAANVSLSAGAQSFRTYTSNGAVTAGGLSAQQRIDSGSVQGAGITLARGLNDILVKAYGSSNTNYQSNISGVITINYESDIPANGIGAAAHTIFKNGFSHSGVTALSVERGTLPAFFPDTEYWLTDIGCIINLQNGTASLGFSLTIEKITGESPDNGWVSIYTDLLMGDPEIGSSIIWSRAREAFKRHPNDADQTRMDPTVSRLFQWVATATPVMKMALFATLHNMKFTASGNISGHNASLPTTVKLIRAVDGMLYAEQELTAGDTSFSFDVYDDSVDYYVDAYQDATHVGRSALAKAA